MQKHQSALTMRETPNQRMAVAAMATVHITIAKTAPTKTPRGEATGQATPPRERQKGVPITATIAKAAISHVLALMAIIVKAVTSKGKAAISPALATIAKEAAISPVKAISLVKVISKEKEAISKEKEATVPVTTVMAQVTPQKVEPEGASVLEVQDIILMRSTA